MKNGSKTIVWAFHFGSLYTHSRVSLPPYKHMDFRVKLNGPAQGPLHSTHATTYRIYFQIAPIHLCGGRVDISYSPRTESRITDLGFPNQVPSLGISAISP